MKCVASSHRVFVDMQLTSHQSRQLSIVMRTSVCAFKYYLPMLFNVLLGRSECRCMYYLIRVLQSKQIAGQSGAGPGILWGGGGGGGGESSRIFFEKGVVQPLTRGNLLRFQIPPPPPGSAPASCHGLGRNGRMWLKSVSVFVVVE